MPIDLVAVAERDLRATGALSETTRHAFASAEPETRRGLAASFSFLGCPEASKEEPEVAAEDLSAPRRIDAIRLMLLRFGAHTDDPRWSSYLLEKLYTAAGQPPGAQLSDLIQAMFSLLAEHPDALSAPRANLIRELAIYVVARRRAAYATEDFSWLASAVLDEGAEPTAAQAYLAAYTLPPAHFARCRQQILHALRTTRFADEVARDLAD